MRETGKAEARHPGGVEDAEARRSRAARANAPERRSLSHGWRAGMAPAPSPKVTPGHSRDRPYRLHLVQAMRCGGDATLARNGAMCLIADWCVQEILAWYLHIMLAC